jgi:hypothetical protein
LFLLRLSDAESIENRLCDARAINIMIFNTLCFSDVV